MSYKGHNSVSPHKRRHKSSGNGASKTTVMTRTFMTFGSALSIVLFFQVLLYSSVSLYEGQDISDVMFAGFTENTLKNPKASERHEIEATQTPEAAPLPEYKDKQGRMLFNPEEFRVGDRSKYVNFPLQKSDKSKIPTNEAPKPIDLMFEGRYSGNDVVVSIIHNGGLFEQRYKRLIASLRATGYAGNIILGIQPNVPEKALKILKDSNVTVYTVTPSKCQSPIDKYKDNHGKPLKCFKSVEKLPVEWGKYELARRWIEECKTCTGRVLLALDGKTTFFQSNPFANLDVYAGKDLLFSEELAPHTDPFYYDPDKEDTRHTRLGKNFISRAKSCYGDVDKNTFGVHRPMLTPSTVIGSRERVLGYLAVLAAELEKSIKSSSCKLGTMNEKFIMNYLYYKGVFAGATDQTMTMPWGTGIMQGLEKPCWNGLQKNSTKGNSDSQLDIVRFDFNTSGFIVNRYEPENSPFQIPAVIHHYDTCNKWIKAFFKVHGDINGDPFVKPSNYGEIVEYTIRDSVIDRSHLPGGKQSAPMKTSFQKATVIQQAPWFPAEKICRQTCCAEAVAISLDADDHHLLTSADGLDLADIGVYGHKRKEFLQWAISDLNFDIIPCLQKGAIIYADHEGGGAKRFFDIYRPKLTQPYLLVTGGTDGIEPLKPKNQGKEILQNDDLLIKWYGINGCFDCGANLPKFKMMHLGLSAQYPHQKFLTGRLESRGFDNPFANSKKSRWINSMELSTAKDATRLLFVKFNINEHSQHR